MTECYAHTGPDAEDVSTWQTLSEHANEVARRAEVFAEKFDMAAWGRTLGLLHDAGKVSVSFRRRWKAASRSIIRRREQKSLSIGMESAGNSWHTLSAGITADCLTAKLGRNAHVPDGVLAPAAHKDRLGGEIECLLMLSSSWSRQGKSTFPMLTSLALLCGPVENVREHGKKAFSMFVLEHFLYSSLVDGDYLDTERFMTPEASEARGGTGISPAWKSCLRSSRATWLILWKRQTTRQSTTRGARC